MDVIDLKPISVPTIPKDFHFKLRTRFLNKLKSTAPAPNSVCLFKGIETVHKNYDDIDYKVDQESTFWYFYGVNEADCYGAIEVDTGKAVLFPPRLGKNLKMWMTILSPEEMLQKYQVDTVLYSDEIQQYLKKLSPSTVYIFKGADTDSGLETIYPTFQYLNQYKVDNTTLFPMISNIRAVKTPEEIEIMRYVAKIGTQSHLRAMRHAKPGLTQNQLHGVFLFNHISECGCDHLAFNSICSSGRDCATLHYIDNDKILQEGQLLLHDMGGKWYGYCTDQAITFPLNGKFTPKQLQVYEAVRLAQKAVEEVAKEGVEWTQMHLLAQRIILEHLIEMGIVVNADNMAYLQEIRLGAVFFPHGLGHLLGLKTHDLGGYTEGPERSTKPGLKSLRTRRTLEEGIIITVEPGLYFIEYIIQEALENPVLSKHLSAEKIKEYMEVGGVRLEDVVLITKTGCEVLSQLPRLPHEVEAYLAKHRQL